MKYIEEIFNLNKIQRLPYKDTVTKKFIVLKVGDVPQH